MAPGVGLRPLAWSDKAVGTVTPAGCELPAGIRVTTGTFDARAEALSVGLPCRGPSSDTPGTGADTPPHGPSARSMSSSD
ncbi:hypothetical protein GCM10010381_02470 [Streptomyces xantholiticus]|nr:hypothetical protein GCM10010381_02470 [Streptomyces xantholiticus]